MVVTTSLDPYGGNVKSSRKGTRIRQALTSKYESFLDGDRLAIEVEWRDEDSVRSESAVQHRQQYGEAVLVQQAGEEQDPACFHCRNGNGPFEHCHVVKNQYAACGNCIFQNRAQHCSFAKKPPKKRKKKDESSDNESSPDDTAKTPRKKSKVKDIPKKTSSGGNVTVRRVSWD